MYYNFRHTFVPHYCAFYRGREEFGKKRYFITSTSNLFSMMLCIHRSRQRRDAERDKLDRCS